jgi:hypothetical protein
LAQSESAGEKHMIAATNARCPYCDQPIQYRQETHRTGSSGVLRLTPITCGCVTAQLLAEPGDAPEHIKQEARIRAALHVAFGCLVGSVLWIPIGIIIGQPTASLIGVGGALLFALWMMWLFSRRLAAARRAQSPAATPPYLIPRRRPRLRQDDAPLWKP